MGDLFGIRQDLGVIERQGLHLPITDPFGAFGV